MAKIRLEYKGYYGVYSFVEEEAYWYGKLDEITDLVTFEADEFEDIPLQFMEAVDDYIDVCEQIGKKRES